MKEENDYLSLLSDKRFVALATELFSACRQRLLPDGNLSQEEKIDYVKGMHLHNGTRKYLLKIAKVAYLGLGFESIADYREMIDEATIAPATEFIQKYASDFS